MTRSAICVASAAVLLLAATGAKAGDFNGFHFGIDGGPANGAMDWQNTSANNLNFKTQTAGGFIGANTGYDWAKGSILFGFGTEINWADITGQTNNVSAPVAPGATDIVSYQTQWFGSLDARIGEIQGPMLFYLVGGAAAANLNQNYYSTPAATPVSLSSTFWGWSAGIGTNIQLGGNWVGTLEYRHYDFGSQSFPTTGILNSHNVSFLLDAVKFGLSYDW